MVTTGIVTAFWIIFFEYPNSAIETTRNRLFSLRDELFELAQKGEIPFDSDAYKFARGMVNGMIRYAHDISGLQLLMALLTRTKSTVLLGEETQRKWVESQSKLTEKNREQVKAIVDRATDEMMRLVVARSLILSLVWTLIFIVFSIEQKIKGAPQNSIRITTIPKENQEAHTETAVNVILHKNTINRVRPIIKDEASRYASPRKEPLLAA